MTTAYFVLAVVPAVVIIGAVLTPVLSHLRRAGFLQDQYVSDYDNTMRTMNDKREARAELNEWLMDIESYDVRPLSPSRRQRYSTDWVAIQSKFANEPGKAIADANRLIIEFMQILAYPVSDFEQQADDTLIGYPALITNYRAARKIAIKNEQHLANAEELRQAMMHYRSLFEELLESEAVATN